MTTIKEPAIGTVFGRWTVIGICYQRNQQTFAPCQCICGTRKDVRACNLFSGRSRGCYCYRRAKRVSKKSGSSRNPEYRIWHGLKQRCLNPKNKRYKAYGGRGITVCDRWLHSYENFLADMGRRPSPKHSLDRKDNNGDYTLENCQWATRSEQDMNKRRTIYLPDGRRLADVAIPGSSEYQRLRRKFIVMGE